MLGAPKGQRAATRKGRGSRPSWRATDSKSLEASGIRLQASGSMTEVFPLYNEGSP
jgi:hypothetical protein